jgi:general secretion pathway protein K
MTGYPIPPERSETARNERGVALVMVVWVLALLSLVAASFLAEARVEARLAFNLAESAEAEALADGGIHIGAARLLGPGGIASGVQVRQWTENLGQGEVEIRIADERGKIDLNGAGHDLLVGLFRSQGASAEAASALAGAVVDFRDADHDLAAGGAEDAAYSALGLENGAKDAPFETVEELLQVRGVTPDLFQRVAPLLTTHTHAPGVDPFEAEPAVLAAIPGMSRADLDRLVALRRKLRAARAKPNPNMAAAGVVGEADRTAAERQRLLDVLKASRGAERSFIFDWSTAAWSIVAEGRTPEGGRFRRAAVLRLIDDPNRPYLIVGWRRLANDE